ncbi:protein PF14_0175-like, partial [Aphidius gifuensis]|uniref:protein PF14_0175-like n=1 Tax=Aphidius gifuensis TaxID=684658 RepID=UPI001CDBB04C
MANIAFNNLFYFNKRKQLNSINNDKTDDDGGDKLSKLLKLCRPLSIILHRLTDEEIDHWQDSHRYNKTYNRKLSSKLNDDSDDKSIKTPTSSSSPSSSSLSLSSSTASTASTASSLSTSSSSSSPIIKKNFTRIKEKNRKRISRWARGFIKKKIPTRKSVARNRLISSSSSSSSNVTDLNSASSVTSTSTTLSLKKVNNETEEDDSGNDNTITNEILTNNNKENKNDNDADDHCEWKFKRKFNTLINSDSDDVSPTASSNKKVKKFHPNKLLSTSSSNESIDEPNDNSNDNNIINLIDKQNNVTNDVVVIKKENIINHELLDETSNDCQIIAADNIDNNNVQDDNDSSKCRDVIEINIENVGTEDSSMITDDDDTDDDDDDDNETINGDVPEIEKTLDNDDTSLHENIINSNESILNNKTSNINDDDDDDLTKNNNIINNDDNETELVNEYLTDDNSELKRLCEIKMAKVVLQRVEPNDIINNEKDDEDEDLTDSDIDEESYINYEPDNNYDKNIETPLLTVKSKVSIDNFNNDNLYKKRLSNNQTSASPDNSASDDNDSDYEPSSLSNVSVTSENTINASKKTTSDNDSGSFTSAMSSNELFKKLPANENDRTIVNSEQLISHQSKINKTAIEQQNVSTKNTLDKTTNNTQQFNDQIELLNIPNNTITIQEIEQQKNSSKSPNKNKTSTCNKCSENLSNHDNHVCSSPGSSNTPSKNNRVKKNQHSPRSNKNKSKKKKDKKLKCKVECDNTCLVCTLTLDTPEQLATHLFKHTKKELRESFRNKKYESNVPLFSDASTSDESDKEIERIQKNNNDIDLVNEKTDKVKVCQCHDVNNNDTTNVQIEMVLYCETCSVLFRRNECFELHYRYNVKCNENRAKGKLPQLFCTTCCIVLRSLGDMRKHLEDHASKDTQGTVNFVCNICKVIFFGIGTVFCTHWFSHEKDPNFVASRYSFPKLCVNDSIKLPDGAYPDEKYISVAEYVCKYCGSQFSMASEVSRHIENDGCQDKNNKKNNTDKKIDNVNQNNLIPVIIAPKITISTRSSLTNRITTKAFKPISPVPSETPTKTPTPITETPTKTTTTNDNNSIINNKNNNLNKSPSSSSSSGAKTDMIKKFICGFCDKVFPQQSLFDEHTSDHLQSPGFPGYLCYFPKDMKAGFVCNVCRAVFTTVNELTNHWNTHNIIKFTCTVCDESFSSMSVLYRHVSNNCFKFDAGCRITYNLNKNICKHCKIGHNTVDELKEHKCHDKINDKKIVEAETTQPSLPIVESSKNNDKTITTTTSVSTVAVADSSQSNDEGPSSTQDTEINSITNINNNNNDNDDVNTQSTNEKLLEKQSVITKSSINSSISLPEKSKTRALEDPSVQVVLSNASSSNISASLVIDSQTTTSNNKPTKFSLKVNNNNNNAEKIINNETIEYTDCDLNNIDDEMLQNSRNEIDEIIRNTVIRNSIEDKTNESSINVNNEKINDVIISSSECENNKTIPTVEKSITNKETSEKNLPIDNDDD